MNTLDLPPIPSLSSGPVAQLPAVAFSAKVAFLSGQMDPVPSEFASSDFPLPHQAPPVSLSSLLRAPGANLSECFGELHQELPCPLVLAGSGSVGALEETGGGEGFVSLAASWV